MVSSSDEMDVTFCSWFWNGVFLSFRVPSLSSFPVLHVPSMWLYTVCCFSFGVFVDCTTVFGLFVRPSISEIPHITVRTKIQAWNIARYSSVFQIPVDYPVLCIHDTFKTSGKELREARNCLPWIIWSTGFSFWCKKKVIPKQKVFAVRSLKDCLPSLPLKTRKQKKWNQNF